MTFEERIEKLLNQANNTIEDIPKSYDWESRWNANKAAYERGMRNEEYICYLSNIIDRLEWALTNTLIREDK